MQRRVFNCATFRAANTTDISGRITADRTNRGLRTGKEGSFWCIPSRTFLGSLMVAGLFFTLAPMPAHADEDKDRHRGREDNDKEIRAQITALQATVSALQSQVNTLQTANTDQQNEINSLQTSNTALQNQLAHAKNVLALDPFVSVDPNPEIGVVGPHITFKGANIHIVSGSGTTYDNGNPTGLGNLIIGYDEDPSTIPGFIVGPGFGHPPSFPPLKLGDRGGSHNLVIGGWHRFTQAASGGFVAGVANVIGGEGASVSGGEFNIANGGESSVSGGGFNTASGPQSSVSGGGINTSGGAHTVVIGGSDITNNNVSILPQPPFP
jgi:hypothetical protein